MHKCALEWNAQWVLFIILWWLRHFSSIWGVHDKFCLSKPLPRNVYSWANFQVRIPQELCVFLRNRNVCFTFIFLTDFILLKITVINSFNFPVGLWFSKLSMGYFYKWTCVIVKQCLWPWGTCELNEAHFWFLPPFLFLLLSLPRIQGFHLRLVLIQA